MVDRALVNGVRVTVALVLLVPLIAMVPPLPVTYYPSSWRRPCTLVR